MKASEFVKKFGWDEAKAFLSFDSDVEIVYTASFFDDLKRLVESHELVKEWGGLNSITIGLASEKRPRLKQAITDVESCL